MPDQQAVITSEGRVGSISFTTGFVATPKKSFVQLLRRDGWKMADRLVNRAAFFADKGWGHAAEHILAEAEEAERLLNVWGVERSPDSSKHTELVAAAS